MDIKKTDDTYVAHTYGRFPVAFVSGKGAKLYDDEGKEYIDLSTGIATNVFGVADDQWVAAVTAQLGNVQHTSNLYYTEPCAKLAQLLCERTGMKKVFFSNSGAEANECAIKTARRWQHLNYGGERPVIITLKNSFHGRTITTLAATGQDVFHTEFGPFTEGFVYADPNVPGDLTRLAEENPCCAVMIETVQGEGGVNPLSTEFVAEVNAVAEKHGLLIIVDEVQTGNGRTGRLYGYMNFDLKPDIVSTAKGLGGGLPIGACMLGERVQDVLTPGSHGSTFGGNPVCCAGAVSVIERLDDALLEGVRQRSEYIIIQLNGSKGVKSISGLGLMLGIETERPAKEVISGCLERGVVVISAKNKVRLLPPLNIDMDDLKKAINILKEELAK
ncbi:MAG: aspartate aminotransferase family protein [Ruminococcaceae bacterium]|nr:aspartate aminotransferase family protein [Oscillospiraceae bacterium]